MRLRRIAAALAVAAVAGGGALVLDSAAGSAATPAPTPITLDATGMGAAFCPVPNIPINGSVAIKPGVVLFKPGLAEGGLGLSSVSLSVQRETNPPQAPAIYSVPSAGKPLTFSSLGTYDLSWQGSVLGVLGPVKVGSKGKLIVASDVQKCAVAVQVPTPSVSVSGVPDPVTSTVNRVVGGVVSGVNGVLNPVNGVVGPIVGGGTSGLPIPGGGSGGGVPSPVAGGGVGTNYHPTGPTVAQRTVPQGYGNGSGVGGSYVSGGTSGSSGGVSSGSGATAGKSGSSHQQQQIKSGGSPKTVQLAADKPRSALDGWSALIVLAAVLALSGATAFYARSYLLHPMPAKVQR